MGKLCHWLKVGLAGWLIYMSCLATIGKSIRTLLCEESALGI
jgi:hypothetical protein